MITILFFLPFCLDNETTTQEQTAATKERTDKEGESEVIKKSEAETTAATKSEPSTAPQPATTTTTTATPTTEAPTQPQVKPVARGNSKQEEIMNEIAKARFERLMHDRLNRHYLTRYSPPKNRQRVLELEKNNKLTPPSTVLSRGLSKTAASSSLSSSSSSSMSSLFTNRFAILVVLLLIFYWYFF